MTERKKESLFSAERKVSTSADSGTSVSLRLTPRDEKGGMWASGRVITDIWGQTEHPVRGAREGVFSTK